MTKPPVTIHDMGGEQVLALIQKLPDKLTELPIELQLYCDMIMAESVGVNPSMSIAEIGLRTKQYHERPARDRVALKEAVRAVLIHVLLVTMQRAADSPQNNNATLTLLTLAIHHNEYAANRNNDFEIVPGVDDHPLAEGIREWIKKTYPEVVTAKLARGY